MVRLEGFSVANGNKQRSHRMNKQMRRGRRRRGRGCRSRRKGRLEVEGKEEEPEEGEQLVRLEADSKHFACGMRSHASSYVVTFHTSVCHASVCRSLSVMLLVVLQLHSAELINGHPV